MSVPTSDADVTREWSPLPPIQHELYYDALTLMDEVLLPALSLAECNCCLAEEIWTVLRVYPYNHRYDDNIESSLLNLRVVFYCTLHVSG